MTDLNVVKSAALSDENKVTAIDLFAFDAASGLLEVMQRDIPAKAPSDAGVAGEKKVGDVSLSFGKGGANRQHCRQPRRTARFARGGCHYLCADARIGRQAARGQRSALFSVRDDGLCERCADRDGFRNGFALPQSGPVRHRQPDAGRRVRRIGRFEATTAERACARLPVQRWLQCIRS